MSRFRQSEACSFARMTFVLAGVFALACFALTSSAQAGCGDYVFIRNSQGQLVRPSSLMKEHGGCTGPNCHQSAEDDEVSLPTDSLPVPTTPCHGPNCSGRSSLPASPSPLPAPSRTGSESSALLAGTNIDGSEACGNFGRASSSTAHELHYPQSIFHPPR